MKKYSRKLKTHVQVLGISASTHELKNNAVKSVKKLKETTNLRNQNNELSNEIKSLKTQVSLINQLMQNMYSIAVIDINKKNEFLSTSQSM